jgi:hypothetical protein
MQRLLRVAICFWEAAPTDASQNLGARSGTSASIYLLSLAAFSDIARYSRAGLSPGNPASSLPARLGSADQRVHCCVRVNTAVVKKADIFKAVQHLATRLRTSRRFSCI